MLLVKMGGSVITDKSSKESPRPSAITGMARAIARAKEPTVVVHGGGSYGHYWSTKYGMHTKPGAADPRGVARVKRSMIELNSIVLDAMARAGLAPYCMPPSALVSGKRLLPSRAREAARIAKSGMVPVTYGDALWSAGKTYILSGDRLMSMLAPAVEARLAVFATAVDGVYDAKGRVIKEMGGRRAVASGVPGDVTGGMARKISESRRIARAGTDALITNGNKPDRMIYAAGWAMPRGTLFRG